MAAKPDIDSEIELDVTTTTTTPPPAAVSLPEPPLPEEEQLDEEEQEFRALRRDLPGVQGASAAGIVSISVGKTPLKNEFFRVNRDFRPIMKLVDTEVGMEKQFFAVTSDMTEPLSSIGITVADQTLYLTITSRGAVRIVPIRGANSDGDQKNTRGQKKSR